MTVRGPLRRVTGKASYDIPGFAKHLKEFCHVDRGSILQRVGDKHKVRFRFSNPLMQPLVLMQGVVDNKIDMSVIEELAI